MYILFRLGGDDEYERKLLALEIFMRLSNKLKMQRYNALKMSGISCHTKEMKIP